MRGLMFALLGQAAISACSADASKNHSARCDEVTSCELPLVCYRGFCIQGHDVPAIDLDAASTPITADAASTSSESPTNVEAGAPGVPAVQTPGSAAAPGANDAGAPITIGSPTSDDAAAPTATPPAPASTPPAQTTTPPAQTTTPPAQTTTPPAQTTTPPTPASDASAPPGTTAPVDPVPPVVLPSAPVEPPGGTPPDVAVDAGTRTPDLPPAGGGTRAESPLLACIPACVTRSVFCLVCLSGGGVNYSVSCDEREQRANPVLRELCDFLCSALECQ